MGTAKNAIISVAAGRSQIALIRAMKNKSFSVIGIDRNPNAEGFKYCDECIIESTHDATSIIKKLDALKVKWNFCGVSTQSSGVPVVTAAKIAEHFHLRYILPTIAENIIDKGLLLSALNDKGLSSPKVMVVSRSEDIDVDFSPPFFVKPSICLKSHTAMIRVEEVDHLARAIDNALAVSANGNVNIEQYIPGNDLVSIDLVFDKKIIHVATIEEINSGEPHFYGLGWKLPLSIEFENAAKTLQEQFIRRFNIDYSLVQTAMKFDGKKAHVIEVHLDLGGDGVPDILLPYSLNYNLIEQVINITLGVYPSGPQVNSIPTYFRFILKSDIKGNTNKFMNCIIQKFNARFVEFDGMTASMDKEQRVAALVFQAATIEELNLNMSEFENWLKRGVAL